MPFEASRWGLNGRLFDDAGASSRSGARSPSSRVPAFDGSNVEPFRGLEGLSVGRLPKGMKG
jgi:hypothetical protein